MNRMWVPSGTRRKERIAYGLTPVEWRGASATARPPRRAGERDRGEHGGHDAHAERDREAAHRAGAERVEQDRRDQRREIGVDDRAQGLPEAGIDGGDRRPAVARLLPDPLVDQNVGIDRLPDRQHDAGDAGQRESRLQDRERGEHEQQVDHQREVGDQPEQAIVDHHECRDQDERRPRPSRRPRSSRRRGRDRRCALRRC